MKGKPARQRSPSGTTVRRPPPGDRNATANGRSVDDASLRALARALLALAEELIEREGKQG
jgi:hypothetical protein